MHPLSCLITVVALPLLVIPKAHESCAPGFIPTPGDVLEFELEKGKLECPVEVSCFTTEPDIRKAMTKTGLDAIGAFVLRKKDGTINFTAINVTLATPHAPCRSR